MPQQGNLNNIYAFFVLFYIFINKFINIRWRLRLSHREIVFLPCFAHQLNLCVGEIFKESTDLKTSLSHAIKLATYFKSANNKFFIAKLCDQQKITYRQYYSIATPGETRWNSYYAVCISLLKTKQALQVN